MNDEMDKGIKATRENATDGGKEKDHNESYDPFLLDLTKLEGVHITADGYVKYKTPKGHLTCDGKWIFEHRLVMEKKLKRCLTRGEIVHHKDGNKRNNDIENLELFTSSADHAKRHPTERQKRVPILHDRKWVEDQYVGQGKSISEIAHTAKCCRHAVDRVMKKFGIQKRRYTISQRVIDNRLKGALTGGRKPYIEFNCDAEWIKKEYTERQRSFRDIGQEIGWHKNKVKQYLEKLGVPIRTHQEQASMFLTKYNQSRKK